MQKTFEQALQEAREKFPACVSWIGSGEHIRSGYIITRFGKHLDGTYLYYIRCTGTETDTFVPEI
ncbi:MAG: hypothetical protein K6D03_02745 [Solobacterium sp.]|nr:hypothetical protein [Solobacterium sp.]